MHRPRRSTSIARLTFSLTLIALILGCSSPDKSPGAGRGDPYPAPMNDPQISMLTPDLREWIGFQPAVITRDGERLTNVQVPTRNLTERTYILQFRYIFLDADGRQLEPVLGWERVTLAPKQVVRLNGDAALVDAHDYRLEVGWAR